MSDAKEGIRLRLKEALKKIPSKVNEGSVQTVRNYKKFYTKAAAAADSSHSTAEQLQGFMNTYYSYQGQP